MDPELVKDLDQEVPQNAAFVCALLPDEDIQPIFLLVNLAT